MVGETPTRESSWRATRSRGAAAVEFALVLPLLLGVLLSIIEAGSVYNTVQDANHDAQAAARLAAVDFGREWTEDDLTDVELIQAICTEIDGDADTTVWVTLPDGSLRDDRVIVTVRHEISTLTGIYESALASKYTEATVSFKLERNASFPEAFYSCPPEGSTTRLPQLHRRRPPHHSPRRQRQRPHQRRHQPRPLR